MQYFCYKTSWKEVTWEDNIKIDIVEIGCKVFHLLDENESARFNDGFCDECSGTITAQNILFSKCLGKTLHHAIV
jgi:hypothetical protein